MQAENRAEFAERSVKTLQSQLDNAEGTYTMFCLDAYQLYTDRKLLRRPLVCSMCWWLRVVDILYFRYMEKVSF